MKPIVLIFEQLQGVYCLYINALRGNDYKWLSLVGITDSVGKPFKTAKLRTQKISVKNFTLGLEIVLRIYQDEVDYINHSTLLTFDTL